MACHSAAAGQTQQSEDLQHTSNVDEVVWVELLADAKVEPAPHQ